MTETGKHVPLADASCEREFHVVLLGATGFTGSLAAEYLASTYPPGHETAPGATVPLRWALAGRSEAKLEALREHLAGVVSAACAELPLVVCDVMDDGAVNALVSRTRVVVSTAGPFSLLSSPVVAACVAHGTHYCDITGETPWVREMIDAHHADAEAAGVHIVPCCGYDSMPSDIGTFALAEFVRAETGEGTGHVSAVARVSGGGVSGGTIASMIQMVDNVEPAVFRDPFLLNPADARFDSRPRCPEDRDQQGARFDELHNRWTSTFAMAGVNSRVVRRSAALRREWGMPTYERGDRFTYQESMAAGGKWWARAASAVLGLLVVLLYFRLTRRLLFWLHVVPRPGEGPGAASRASARFSHTLITEAVDGRRARAVVRGTDPGYGETARMISEAAVTLALHGDQLPAKGGVLTPATSMGGVLRSRLARIGLDATVEWVPPPGQ